MSLPVYIGLLVVVEAALVYSLYAWWCILQRETGRRRTMAQFFTICFALYAVGQGTVLLYAFGIQVVPFDVSPYLYAAAAALFAVGSWHALRPYKDDTSPVER